MTIIIRLTITNNINNSDERELSTDETEIYNAREV